VFPERRHSTAGQIPKECCQKIEVTDSELEEKLFSLCKRHLTEEEGKQAILVVWD
jgi:hypothetical protein